MGSVAGERTESGQLISPLDVARHLRIRVPATSANLGPGYDCMGMALGLYDSLEVSAAPRRDPSQSAVEIVVDGEGQADLPTDASHLVASLISSILGQRGFHLPDLQVQARNAIPHARGLGSSAAAVATAVAVADALLPQGLSADEQLQIGSRIEGHPDNYAPALRGGLAVSWESGGSFCTAPLSVHPQVRAVVAVPDFVQSTRVARGLLPESVPHADAAQNSGRSALLVHALTSAPEFLLAATEDYLHQQYRRGAFVEAMALVDRLRLAGHAAVISGAGPTVLVLCPVEDAAQSAVGAVEEYAGDTFAPRILPISGSGVTVEEYQR